MAKNRTVEARGPEYENLGANLASLRISRDLSQREVSERLNIVQSTYAGWETGTRKIQLSTIMQLAKFFNVSVDSLIGAKPLELDRKPEETIQLKESEKNLLQTYRKLNNEGKQKLFERADELLDLGYVEKGDVSKMA